jgi:pyrroloquinoline quinone biosynthesis protein B
MKILIPFWLFGLSLFFPIFRFEPKESKAEEFKLIILGTLQDGGSPHIGCKKECCKNLFLHPDENRQVVSLGLVDYVSKKTWLIEATPDFSKQVKSLKEYADFSDAETPEGIFLTHAHIGHYTGLMYLGKEAMNAKEQKVYAMHRMRTFLEQNGPWSQLVSLKNISIQDIKANQITALGNKNWIKPILVPHRDEYSETVGFIISGANKKALFIPDIDKWEKWEQNINELIAQVDYAFLDATFFNGKELNNRNMAEVPHPSVEESMRRFIDLSPQNKNKVWFIHFNHTNPLLNQNSAEYKQVELLGFHIAQKGMAFSL